MKQPVIGIIPALDLGVKLTQSTSTHYLRRTYTEVIASIGAIPLIINLDMPIGAILSLCDGIVLSGGEDIDPELYGQKKLAMSAPDIFDEPRIRSDWEHQLIAACDTVEMPILGICYGMQILNIYYGGTLYQDIATERPESIAHHKTVHDIKFTQPFLGYKTGTVRSIASRHHQAINKLAEGFAVCAIAPDTLIEAVRYKHHYGMQWHPESDETGAHVYRAFAEHCKPALAPSLAQTTV